MSVYGGEIVDLSSVPASSTQVESSFGACVHLTKSNTVVFPELAYLLGIAKRRLEACCML